MVQCNQKRGEAVFHAVIQGPRFLRPCASHIFGVLRVYPYPFYLPHVTADKERWVGNHTGVSKARPISGKHHFYLSPLARTFHWPTILQGELENMLREKTYCLCPIQTPLHLPSLFGLFWDQDLNSSHKSRNSYPSSSLSQLRSMFTALVLFKLTSRFNFLAKSGTREMTSTKA